MATTAEQLRAEGARALLVRLLERKFGPLPKTTRERLELALTPDLEKWSDRVLAASSLDEVFAPNG